MLFNNSSYPKSRPRRNRLSSWSRALVAENKFSADDLILPIFIVEGNNIEQPIANMPDVNRVSIDNLLKVATTAHNLGIQAIVLFPSIEDSKKTENGEEAYNEDGLVQRAVRSLKKHIPALGVMTDVALDPFTSHGQDGLIDDKGYVLNDATVAVLVKQAVSHAQAGADIVAPSDMMDGRVSAIRLALEKANCINTKIVSYAAKYASNYYSPFRDAVGSVANLGKADKNTYQMDTANSNEAMHEIALDMAEGADAIIIKPGILCLDIVYRAKQTFGIPTFLYHVSGEYSLLKLAAKEGLINEKQAVLEAMLASKRAGADAVLTYYATEIASWLKDS